MSTELKQVEKVGKEISSIKKEKKQVNRLVIRW